MCGLWADVLAQVAPGFTAGGMDMARTIPQLLDLLTLVPAGPDRFTARPIDHLRQRVFGGRVAAQALMAASRTVAANEPVRSLHAYFLRPGNSSSRVDFAVERTRDGRVVTHRRVVAEQGGRPIFELSASFQRRHDGFDHQEPMPAAPQPQTLVPDAQRANDDPAWDFFRPYVEDFTALDVRHVAETPLHGLPTLGDAVHRQLWLRATADVGDDPVLHACLLTYVSDLSLIWSALVPHDALAALPRARIASLDHAVWFHRPARVHDWLLYDQTSPSASGGRGLVVGRIFDRSGLLLATVAQEGLIELPNTP